MKQLSNMRFRKRFSLTLASLICGVLLAYFDIVVPVEIVLGMVSIVLTYVISQTKTDEAEIKRDTEIGATVINNNGIDIKEFETLLSKSLTNEVN